MRRTGQTAKICWTCRCCRSSTTSSIQYACPTAVSPARCSVPFIFQFVCRAISRLQTVPLSPVSRQDVRRPTERLTESYINTANSTCRLSPCLPAWLAGWLASRAAVVNSDGLLSVTELYVVLLLLQLHCPVSALTASATSRLMHAKSTPVKCRN